MILKALMDYYNNRCKDETPIGMEYRKISFVIVIKENGDFVRIEDHSEDAEFLVVRGVGHTNKVKGEAHALWDNVKFVCGYAKEAANKDKCHDEFKKECEKISKEYPNNIAFRAVVEFYKKNGIQKVMNDREWEKVKKNDAADVSFRINGKNEIVASDKDLVKYADSNKDAKKDSKKDSNAICLVTGEKGPTVRLTYPTRIYDSNNNAKLVSFKKERGYDSYGRIQGENAPISIKAEFYYTTALNKLLKDNSPNKKVVENRTFVFWSSLKGEDAQEIEKSIFSLFEEDDPNRHIEYVYQIFDSIYKGEKPHITKDRFYLLGLAPNNGRIMVVYWNECSIGNLAENILAHFEDMKIFDCRALEKKSDNDSKPYCGVYQMVSALKKSKKDKSKKDKSKKDKSKKDEIQPTLIEGITKSIIQKTPYPFPLFSTCLQRIRSEQNVNSFQEKIRVAIIKAYLNRINNNNLKLKEMIQEEINNVGYLCGRLFAVIEAIQENSKSNYQEESKADNNGEENAEKEKRSDSTNRPKGEWKVSDIRRKYFNAASTRPCLVFSDLLIQSSRHEDKARRGDLAKMKAEIIDKLKVVNGNPTYSFPDKLNLLDQGNFMVGYYQQKVQIYTPKGKDKDEQ